MKAKNVQNNAKRNEIKNENGSIQYFKSEIARLKDEMTQKLLEMTESEKEKDELKKQVSLIT